MKLPYMPLFQGDLLADTLHLSAQEFGAYMLLILHAWKHDGKIPVGDLRRVARLSNHMARKILQKISQKFDTMTDPNFWIHDRVKIELQKAEEISEKRRDAAMQMHASRRASASHPLSYLKESLLEVSSKQDANGLHRRPEPTAAWHPRIDESDDYRSPPREKSENALQPIPEKSERAK